MCSKDRAKLNSEIEPGLLSGVLGADPPGCSLLQWVGSPTSCLRGAQAVGWAGQWELVWLGGRGQLVARFREVFSFPPPVWPKNAQAFFSGRLTLGLLWIMRVKS